jgi:predicted dehydrogenase
MADKQKLRVGVFGVGRMGRVHFEHLIQLVHTNEVEVVAIGDRDSATLHTAVQLTKGWIGKEYPLNWSLCDSPEMMAAQMPDAVVVASRTADHARDCLAFVSQSIPVLVEKPLANSIQEAVSFCAQLEKHNQHLVQIAFQRYYDAATQLAGQWFDDGLIGDLQQSHHVLQDKNPTPPAYQSCGITADMAIHLVFEAMRFHRFRLPCYVQSLRFAAPYYSDLAGEGANIVHVFCTWPDNSVAHLWGSRINNTGYDNGFKLIGTQGRIDVGEFVGDFGDIHAKLWRGTGQDSSPRGHLADSRTFPMTRYGADAPDFYARFGASYQAELRTFLERVRRADPMEIGLEVGWKTLLVANTAEASSRRNGLGFELVTPVGNPIVSLVDAEAFARQHSIQ